MINEEEREEICSNTKSKNQVCYSFNILKGFHLKAPNYCIKTKKKQGWSLYLTFCCAAICLASFQLGYNIGSTPVITSV